MRFTIHYGKQGIIWDPSTSSTSNSLRDPSAYYILTVNAGSGLLATHYDEYSCCTHHRCAQPIHMYISSAFLQKMQVT